MGRNGFRVNAGKTEIMIRGTGLDLPQAKANSHVPSVALV